MNEIIPALLMLLGIGFGFFLGRLPIDAKLQLPKRKPKPKPMVVTNRQGEIQKPQDMTINPIESFLEGMEQ